MRYEEFKEELLREMRLYVMLQMPHPEEYRIEDLGKCYKNNLKQDEICVYREQDDAGVCVYPEKDMLFRFVISQRDTLPSGSTFWLFLFCRELHAVRE